eukprot:2635862-Rhodomonas_salina.1
MHVYLVPMTCWYRTGLRKDLRQSDRRMLVKGGDFTAKFRHRLSGSRPSRAGGHVVAKEEAAFMRRDVCEAAFAAAGGTDTATKA